MVCCWKTGLCSLPPEQGRKRHDDIIYVTNELGVKKNLLGPAFWFERVEHLFLFFSWYGRWVKVGMAGLACIYL